MRDEEKASRIDIDLSDVEKALGEIVEKEAVVEETMQNALIIALNVDNAKKNVDNAKAAEIRYRALENLGETKKRQRKDGVESETAARAKC